MKMKVEISRTMKTRVEISRTMKTTVEITRTMKTRVEIPRTTKVLATTVNATLKVEPLMTLLAALTTMAVEILFLVVLHD